MDNETRTFITGETERLAQIVKQGFDAIEERLDGVDKRFDGVDMQLQQIKDILLEDHHKRIASLEHSVRALQATRG